MQIRNFTVESDFDGLPLSCAAYEPDSPPAGIFQIVHGMCEHKKRYDEFMRFSRKTASSRRRTITAATATACVRTPISAGFTTRGGRRR